MVFYPDSFAFWKSLLECKDNLFWLEVGTKSKVRSLSKVGSFNEVEVESKWEVVS